LWCNILFYACKYGCKLSFDLVKILDISFNWPHRARFKLSNILSNWISVWITMWVSFFIQSLSKNISEFEDNPDLTIWYLLFKVYTIGHCYFKSTVNPHAYIVHVCRNTVARHQLLFQDKKATVNILSVSLKLYYIGHLDAMCQKQFA